MDTAGWAEMRRFAVNRDRTFAVLRERAVANPLTRAGGAALPAIELPGGVAVALSVNK